MELINIFDDLKKGMDIEDVIKKYKISLSRLIKIVKYHNNTGINYEEKISKEIYNLRKQEVTYEKIAKTYNASTTFIREFIKKYCTENNLDIPEIISPNQVDLPVQEMYNMRKNGIFLEDLSKKCGVSNYIIRRRLKEYCDENNLDVPKKTSSKAKVDLPMSKIYNMKKNKVSIEEISWEYGVSEFTIYNKLMEYCTENNLDFPKVKFQNKKIDLPVQEIYNMRKNGISIEDLSKKYGVSKCTINNRLKDKNLEILLYLFQKIVDKGEATSIDHFSEIENAKII